MSWLKTMLHARGLEIVETTPEDHDRVMSVVQVLTHFTTEVMGRTLAALGSERLHCTREELCEALRGRVSAHHQRAE